MDVFEEIANRKDSNQFNHFIYWKDYTLTHFYPTKKTKLKCNFRQNWLIYLMTFTCGRKVIARTSYHTFVILWLMVVTIVSWSIDGRFDLSFFYNQKGSWWLLSIISTNCCMQRFQYPNPWAWSVENPPVAFCEEPRLPFIYYFVQNLFLLNLI